MSKYSVEFKLKVVREYLQGKSGATLLAKKYNISSSGLLRSWIRKYKAEGSEAFFKKIKQNNSYTRDFKENAVKLYLTSELTYEEVSYQLGISTLNLVASWVNQFRIYGEIPERIKRGRPRKIGVNETVSVSKSSSDKDKERIKSLERELRYAKIEVEYLKGLRRLGKDVQMNKKHDLSTISENNTNSKNF